MSASTRKTTPGGTFIPFLVSARCTADSDSPSMYSITRYVMSCCSPTSKIWATFACSMREAIRVSS